MIPTLYDKTGNNKIGVLNDCIECFVEEERNGIFELTMIYPANSSILESIVYDNIVVADANDYLKSQKFRIYNTRKLMANRIEICARHISFDLVHDWVDVISLENQSCEYALNTIFRNSQFSKHFKGYSDIINAQNFKVNKVTCLEAIGGTDGSIIDTYGTGAEILRDNTDIHVLNRRGHDNDVVIEYRKNLTGLEVEEDTTDLVTRIMPYAIYTNSNNEEVEVRGDFINSPLINNYAHPYVKYMDYSEEFEDGEVPTKTKLNNLATKEYTINKIDIPKCNYKIEFIPLSKCAGYEGLEDRINLCDVVTVKDSRYNINTQAKVIKVTFDVLRDRYDSMELGEPRTTLGDIIGGTGDGPTQGPPGPPGPQGPAGADGSIGDFPETLPKVPSITAKVYGFANIELSWTFENKVYYSYELYASKIKGFTPNTFNLIFSGQASTYLFQAEPGETWYFRACALNTHGQRTEFSEEVEASTVKISDLSNYVESAAIGDALIGELNLGRGWYGELKGNYIDAKQMSVTDGNGKRTLDIDSFGNVNLDVASLKIKSSSVATNNDVNNALSNYPTTAQVNSAIEQSATSIKNTVSQNYYNKNDIDSKGYQTSSDVEQTVNSLEIKFTESGGYNMLKNGSFMNGISFWSIKNSATTENDTSYPYGTEKSRLIFSTNTWSGIYQDVTFVIGETYSWTAHVKVEKGSIYIGIEGISSKTITGYMSNWLTVSGTFKATKNVHRFVVTNTTDTSATIRVHGCMVCRGSLPQSYTPHPSEIYDGVTTIDKDGITVTHSNANTKSIMGADGFKVVRTSDNKNLFNATSGNLTMEGTLATGTSGKYVKVSDSNYKVYNGSTQKAFFGLFDNDTFTAPRLSLSADAVGSSNYDGYSISMYKRNDNPSNSTYDYMDMSYNCSKLGDYSNMKMFGNGDIKLAPVRDLEISSNYHNGTYDNPNGHEYTVAKFSTSSSSYYNGNMEIGAIVNKTNGNGLVLEDSRNSRYSSVQVYVNPNTGERSFRPMPAQTGTIYSGTSNATWKAIYSSSGSIQTSDERYKMKMGVLNNLDCFEMVKNTDIYKYCMLPTTKDGLPINELKKIAKKSSTDDVSIQAGIMAQDLSKYDCAKYILTHDFWVDEDTGEEREKYNINPYAFAAAIMGALKEEINKREALEKRVETLEEKLNQLESKL